MLPYYCMFMLIALLSCTDIFRIRYKQRIIFYFVLWCILSLFAGLRMNNPDWESYCIIFEEIASGEGPGSSDIGFNILCWFISCFTNNPIAMFLCVASISVALNLDSFKKYSPYFILCVLYYFVHIYVLKEMIQIRAGLASAICIYGIRYLAFDRYKQFLIVLCIACSIHFSAIIWILVFFSLKWHFNIKMLKILLGLSLIIGLLCPLGQFIKLFLNGIDERLSAYIAYGDSGYAAELGVFTNLTTVKSILLLIFVFLFEDALSLINIYFKPIIFSYIIGLCWLLIFNDFAIVGARMSNYLLSVEPILISYLFMLFSVKSRWIVFLFLIFITYTMLTLNMAPDKIIPYQFYFL